MCQRRGRAVSELGDHIIPAGVAVAQVREQGLDGDPTAGFFIRSNIQGLCRACHWLKTEEDKLHTGPWPSVLEQDALLKKHTWTF